MPRDIRNTPLQQELFDRMGDFTNPTSEFFSEVFARYKNKEPKYYIDDIIEIGPEQYPGVKPKSITTVGIYIINSFLIKPLKVFGYVNKIFDNKVWGNLEDGIAAALVAKDIEQQDVADFVNRSQFLLGGPLAHIINPSLSATILDLPAPAAKLRTELFNQNKEAFKNNDPIVAAKVAEDITREALRDMEATNDPSLALFKSGTVDPYNNYRTMFVMKGAIADNTGESSTGYKIVKSNYNDGLAKEDIPLIADSLVTSAYSSGVATQDSGVLGKKYNATAQRVMLDKKGSDCGTKEYLKTIITSRHLYRYIVEKGKLVLLTTDNIDKYKGKLCDLRSPIHCHAKDPKYCNICVGERLYRIGINNVGLTFSLMSGALLNFSLKKKHDVTVHTYRCTIDDLMKYVK